MELGTGCSKRFKKRDAFDRNESFGCVKQIREDSALSSINR
jgi:hypothetical protein